MNHRRTVIRRTAVVVGLLAASSLAGTVTTATAAPIAISGAHATLTAHEVDNDGLPGPQGARGPRGHRGARGARGPRGPRGVRGPAGASTQAVYGNVLVAPGASDVLLATVGSFQFWGHCDGGGSGSTLKTTTTNGNSIYDEDGSYSGNFNVGDSVSGDEDYDEAGFARDNATGVTIQYNVNDFNAGDADASSCEFQGVITKTS